MGEREIVKPIIIELGGEEWELKIDLAAMCDFERATGKTVVQFVAPILAALRGAIDAAREGNIESSIEQGIAVIIDMAESNALAASDLLALLWACFGGEDAALSQRDIGRMVGVGNIADVVTQIYKAIVAALPTNNGGDDDKLAETDDDSKNAG